MVQTYSLQNDVYLSKSINFIKHLTSLYQDYIMTALFPKINVLCYCSQLLFRSDFDCCGFSLKKFYCSQVTIRQHFDKFMYNSFSLILYWVQTKQRLFTECCWLAEMTERNWSSMMKRYVMSGSKGFWFL